MVPKSSEYKALVWLLWSYNLTSKSFVKSVKLYPCPCLLVNVRSIFDRLTQSARRNLGPGKPKPYCQTVRRHCFLPRLPHLSSIQSMWMSMVLSTSLSPFPPSPHYCFYPPPTPASLWWYSFVFHALSMTSHLPLASLVPQNSGRKDFDVQYAELDTVALACSPGPRGPGHPGGDLVEYATIQTSSQ